MRKILSTIFLILICGGTVASGNVSADVILPNGAGSFVIQESATGANEDPMPVFYYRPTAWTADRPVVLIFHGVRRNADKYRDDWIKYAEQYNMLIICPEFSKSKYPGVRYYNIGNVADSDDASAMLQPKEKWIFPVVKDIIAKVKILTGAKEENFTLYGHSAGAQFLHRCLFFGDIPKVRNIIIAEAGWYTMPNSDVEFPYGVKNMYIGKKNMAEIFSRSVFVMLGDEDVNRSEVFRKTSLADMQGKTRFARGSNFFTGAKETAENIGVPFRWQLLTVRGAGHNDSEIAKEAAKLINDGGNK
ncbi:alpha/beta hydrolase [Pectinatus haikarae]|uniref:Pimeloyl-ACP methyl ester carboxylesterase n=1 Tax=Pectinatus haikarae TaxID=349096 RepID=A0ABT9Y6W4_9FIRM|nr:alpha/beta hydrolase [Pectinatus haikarae]MDQ0203568.1 pimeloyl-ACP methyl ester carboxylesterase [Pectinatus haikarae]